MFAKPYTNHQQRHFVYNVFYNLYAGYAHLLGPAYAGELVMRVAYIFFFCLTYNKAARV